MTKTEKAIIDAVKAKHKELNALYLPKQEILACIKEHTSHNPSTVLSLMYKRKLLGYDKQSKMYTLANSLKDNYVARDEKYYRKVNVYLDYHADEIMKKLIQVLAYQSRDEIAEFYNQYYIDIDVMSKTMDSKTSSRTLFPDITPEEVDFQCVRIWLYKLYLTCYNFSSEYKEQTEAIKEIAAAMTNAPKKEHEYYVLFDVISISDSDEKNHTTFNLPHIRYFNSLEEAKAFKEMLSDIMYKDNGKKGVELHYYNPRIGNNAHEEIMACYHPLPFDIDKAIF